MARLPIHCTRTAAGAAFPSPWPWLSTAWLSAASQPARPMRTASTYSCPGFCAQPQRSIIHKNEGLIQVCAQKEKGATNRPCRSAASAMTGRNA